MNNIYQAPRADLSRNTTTDTIDDIYVSQGIIDGLSIGRRWAKILAIFGYILCGMIVLGIVLAGFGTLLGGTGMSVWLFLGFAFFAVFAVIVFKLSRILQQYSNAVSHLLDSGDEYDLIESQSYFRDYMKWMSLIMMGSLLIGIIAVLVTTVFLVGALS